MEELPNIAGVPQGPRLGPLLFIIYIIDLIYNLNTRGLIYADDASLAANRTDTYPTSTLLNDDLKKASLMLINQKT